MRIVLAMLLLLGSPTGRTQQINDSFRVYFDKNTSFLSRDATHFIDSLIEHKLVVPIRKVTLLGYADNTGSKGHNDSLSYKRAKSVCDYFVSKGFFERDIALCEGKGVIEREASADGQGYSQDRKVEIVTQSALHLDTLLASNLKKDTATPPPPSSSMSMLNIDKDITNINIKDLKVNDTFQLKDIVFEAGTNTILPQSYPELEKLYKFLDENPTITIQVEGHICCLPRSEGTDEPDGHGTRSQNRAREICKYLAKRGIDKGRMKFVGLGTTKPAVWPEHTEADKVKNRRAVVRILTK